MKAKLAEAKRNLGTLVARKKAAEVRKKVYTGLNEASHPEVDDSAFEKFERLRERVEQAEAEAEALAELQGGGLPESPREPVELASHDDVEAQLAALKRKKRG
jgi:phage shock protein A